MVTVVKNSQTTETIPKSLLLKEKPPSPYNPWWIITSFLMVVAISVYLYIGVDYYYAELVTRDIVVFLLNLTGVESFSTESIGYFFPYQPEWGQFGEAKPTTPGVVIPDSNYPAFWIVKACTGMQAGAILIALIAVTPIPMKGKLTDPNVNTQELSRRQRFQLAHPTLYVILFKLCVIVFFYLFLFLGNAVRIWFHLYLVGAYEIPFSFAHDDLSKPIGFVGTLIFAWIIEKSGVPIIDTFADWMDAFYLWVLKPVIDPILGQLNSAKMLFKK